MAYADLLDDEGINSQYLVVMKPRRLIEDSWTLVSGTIYKISFTLGHVIGVTDDGSELTEASSTSVSSNEWFYDTDNEEVYVDVGADPASSEMVVTYELYFGTFDAHINRVPTDSSTRTVYFEPLIVRSPNIVSSTRDVLFGFLPTFSASIAISNADDDKALINNIHTSSFARADVDMYHWLGDLENANIKLVLMAQCKAISYNDREINFQLLDRSELFNKEYRNPSGTNFFSSSTFTDLDPNFEGRPVRGLFGRVEGLVPVNIDYVADSPTTSDNRDYVVFSFRDSADLNDFSTTVPASPSSTTTRTYVSDISGINLGDQVRNTDTPETIIVRGINKTSSPFYFEHTAATAASTGDTIERKHIAKIQILKEGIIYEPHFTDHWTLNTDGTNKVTGFSFTTGMEAALTIANLEVNDKIWVTAYGEENFVEKSASAFGSNSSFTSNLTDPIVILWQLLKDAGLPEADLDATTFTSLQSSVTDEISMAIPHRSGEDFPTYKDLIVQIAQTLLLKLYLNDSQDWSVAQVGPLGSSDKTVEDDEILKNTFGYNFTYQDIISLAIVQYAFREVSNIGGSEIYKKVNSTSTLAQNLHLTERQKTFTSLHLKDADAQTLADHLRYALGDRRGIARFRAKNRFFDTTLNDVIKVTRDRLPGFPFVEGTDRSTDFSVVKTSKSLREINIDIDDQKGIEDNSGSW